MYTAIVTGELLLAILPCRVVVVSWPVLQGLELLSKEYRSGSVH